MQWLRIFFAILLILAVVPAASVIPPDVSGQDYVTITTQATTTGLYTFPVTTLYATSTETRYVYGPKSFSLAAFCGTSLRVSFNATRGQQFHMEWATAKPIDFYIGTPSIYVETGYTHYQNCVQGQTFYSETAASGSVDWVAPSTGQYTALLVNEGIGGSAEGTSSMQTSAITTVSSVSNSTSPTTKLVNLTTLPTTLHTVLEQNAGFQPALGNLSFLGAGAVVAIVASVFVVARRKKSSLTATLQQERPAAVQESIRDAVASQPVIGTKTIQLPPTILTGYMDLDNALHGGIPEKFGVVVVSPSFDERDLLLRKVIESAVSSGRLAIFVSNDIGRTADLTSRYPNGFYALSSEADKISPQAQNLLKVPKIENLSDASLSLSLTIKGLLAKENKSNPIIVIDILSDMLLRHKSITTRRWLSDFVGKRKAEGFTIMATLNPLTTTREETQTIIDFFDGVIEILEKPLMERSRRFLIIRKMYGRRYSENEVLMDKDKLF